MSVGRDFGGMMVVDRNKGHRSEVLFVWPKHSGDLKRCEKLRIFHRFREGRKIQRGNGGA